MSVRFLSLKRSKKKSFQSNCVLYDTIAYKYKNYLTNKPQCCINDIVNVEATWTHSGPGGGTQRLHHKDIIMYDLIFNKIYYVLIGILIGYMINAVFF